MSEDATAIVASNLTTAYFAALPEGATGLENLSAPAEVAQQVLRVYLNFLGEIQGLAASPPPAADGAEAGPPLW